MSEEFRPIFDDEEEASGNAPPSEKAPDKADQRSTAETRETADAGDTSEERDAADPDVPKLVPSIGGWNDRLDNVSKLRALGLAGAVVALLMGLAMGVRAAVNATSAPAPSEHPVQRTLPRAEPPASLRGLGEAVARDDAARGATGPANEDPYANVDPRVGATTAASLTFDGPVPSAKGDGDDDVVTEEEMARFKAEHQAHLRGGASDATTGAQGSQTGAQAVKGLPPMEVWGTDWAPPGQSKTGTTTPPLPTLPLAGGMPGLGGAVRGDGEAPSGHSETPDDVKEAFAARTGGLDSNSVERELGECEVIAGDGITVGNVDAVNTDIPARAAVVVEVVQDVYCGANHQHIAFPAGSRFTASANARVSYGDARIQLCMDQLQRPPSRGFPNGSLIPITGCWAAAEIDGTVGWAGEVDNHWPKIIGAITLSTALSIGSSASVGNQSGFAPTLAQSAAANAGQQFNQAGNRIVMRELGIKPTLTRDMLQTARVKVTTNQALTPWVPAAQTAPRTIKRALATLRAHRPPRSPAHR